mmetsp:Transcript_13370/g.35907  ORF Transcript_13370/g.35907 Transcript_13370/m.35907 type:complete len:542 (+) Transcript_13370:61-1686(+)
MLAFADMLRCPDVASNIGRMCSVKSLRSVLATGNEALKSMWPFFMEANLGDVCALTLEGRFRFPLSMCLKTIDILFHHIEQGTSDCVKDNAGAVLTEYLAAFPYNPLAFVALKGRLHHAGARVRAHAIIGLGVLLEHGDKATILSLVVDFLSDEAATVRACAVDVVGCAAETGDQHVFSALSACLGDEDADVRSSAARALAKVAVKGQEHAISLLCAGLKDQSAVVREASAFALAEVANKDDVNAISALLRSLGDADEKCWPSAAQSINTLVEHCSPDVVMALCTCLWLEWTRTRTWDDRKLRFVPLSILRRIARHNEHAINTLCVILQDFSMGDWSRGLVDDVHHEMVENLIGVLCWVAGGGSLVAINTLCVHLSQWPGGPFYVDSASAALARLVGDSDMHAILTVAEHLLDEQFHRKLFISIALGRISKAVSLDAAHRVAATFCEWLHGMDNKLRLTALYLLHGFVRGANDFMMVAVSGCLHDNNALIRLEAVRAVSRLAARGDQKALTIVIACLEDEDDRVREAAVKAVKDIHIQVPL